MKYLLTLYLIAFTVLAQAQGPLGTDNTIPVRYSYEGLICTDTVAKTYSSLGKSYEHVYYTSLRVYADSIGVFSYSNTDTTIEIYIKRTPSGWYEDENKTTQHEH